MRQVTIRQMNTSFCIVTKLWAGKGGSGGSETIRNYLLVKRSHCVSKFGSEEKSTLKIEMERDMEQGEGRKKKKSLLMSIFCLPVSGKKNKILFKFVIGQVKISLTRDLVTSLKMCRQMKRDSDLKKSEK